MIGMALWAIKRWFQIFSMSFINFYSNNSVYRYSWYVEVIFNFNAKVSSQSCSCAFLVLICISTYYIFKMFFIFLIYIYIYIYIYIQTVTYLNSLDTWQEPLLYCSPHVILFMFMLGLTGLSVFGRPQDNSLMTLVDFPLQVKMWKYNACRKL